MEQKTESETRPVFDDLNPEMFVGAWELISIIETEDRYHPQEASEHYCDISEWDM